VESKLPFTSLSVKTMPYAEIAPDRKSNAVTARVVPLRRQAETDRAYGDFIAGCIDD
jgi:hypothetical protein